MYADVFEFNGIKSSDLGYYIVAFDGFSNDGVGMAGNDISFATSKTANSYQWNFHGSKYENQLTTSFQIGKFNCGIRKDKNYELSQQDCAFLLRWLVRTDGYKFLRFFQGGYEGYENTFFRVQNKLQWIRFGGAIVGAQIDVTCDAPFGYSDVQTFEVSCDNGGSFTIYNDSDKTGVLYFDETNILMTSDARNLQINNNLDGIYSPTIRYTTQINNCKNGEHITIANHMIATNKNTVHTRENINNDFNFKYPRLINMSDLIETRKNIYTVTGGSCRLSFNYRTIRSVLP
ncbi:MAG: hypothetical protein HFH73_04115 [Lachnospiraceae bacterium]|nr:hypothetical protein [Lachnospiraceae bacterium]